VTGVACAALFALATLSAIDASPASGSVKILSPHMGALETKRAVEVKVKVRGRGKFHAFTSNPRNVDITRRFRRGPGGVRVVRLRGSNLAIGANHLFVGQRVSGKLVANDEVHFTVGRKRPSAIRVSGIHAREHGSVEVRVKPRGVDVLRARLNGRKVNKAFIRRPDTAAGKPRRPWLGSLSLRHGMRFGRNKLVITGFDKESGRYDRLRRVFRVTPDRPLVTAGPDRKGSRRARIPLAGRAKSAPGRTAHRLRWQIVERPKGSKAKLVGAGGGSPALIARDTGHYTIQARASHRIRTGSTLTAPVATDTAELTVQPDALPEGIPIQTIVSDSDPRVIVGNVGGPGISEQVYPMDTSSGAWVQMVVLERDTLRLVSNETYGGFGLEDASDLANDIEGLTNDKLVVVSGGGGGIFPTADQIGQLVAALFGLGAQLSAADAEDDLLAGDFSLVGIPGMGAGNASQLIGESLDGSSTAGAIRGLLQLDTHSNYAFSWPVTNLTFDTNVEPLAASGASNQNVIQVGEQTFPSQTLNGDGFQLVWLDAVSGEPYQSPNGDESNVTYSNDDGGIADFANQLNLLLGDGRRTVILVHSLGHPAAVTVPDTEAWAGAATALQQFGANRYLFAGLDGSGGYSFVGAEGLPQIDGVNAGSELAQSQQGSDTYLPGSDAARITGLLQRNEQGTLTSEVNSVADPNDPDAADFEINPVLAQPDQPFDFDFSSRPKSLGITDQAIKDAQEFIVSGPCTPPNPATPCGGLDLGGVIDPTFGIRGLYWTQNYTATKWSGASNALENLDPSQGQGCNAACVTAIEYLRGDFKKSTDYFQGLETEFSLVSDVIGYLEGPKPSLLFQLQEAQIAGSDWFTSVSADILALYDPPAQAPSGPDVGDILLGVSSIAGGLLGAVPYVGGALSAPTKIAAGISQIMSGAQTTAGGIPAYDPLIIQGDMKMWGGQILALYRGQLNALSIMSDLLVSDQGRLFEAATLINRPAGPDSWQIPKGSELPFQLAASVGRYLYASMLPVPTEAILCEVGDQRPAASESGVYDASLVSDSGKGIEGERILFLVNTAGEGPVFLGPDQVTTLFGQPPSSGTPGPGGPVGFWKPFFMSGPRPGALPVPGTGGFRYASEDTFTFRAQEPFYCQAEPG